MEILTGIIMYGLFFAGLLAKALLEAVNQSRRYQFNRLTARARYESWLADEERHLRTCRRKNADLRRRLRLGPVPNAFAGIDLDDVDRFKRLLARARTKNNPG